MKVISLGICSINMLYPTLIPCFYLIRIIANQNLSANLSETIPFFNTLLVHCGELFAGFVCYLISLFLSKRNGNSDIKEATTNTVKPSLAITILQRKDRKRSKGIYLILVFIVILDNISISTQALASLYNKGEQLAIIMKVFQLYSTTIIAKLLLKIPFYRHQALSIILITMGSVSIMYSFFIFNTGWVTIEFIACLLIINGFGISFYGIGQKYLFEREFFSLTEILLLEGSFGIFLSLSFLFLMNIPCRTERGICKFMFEVPDVMPIFEWVFNDYVRILYVLLSIVISGLLNVFYALTNKIYNPTHRAISDCLCFVFLYVYELITKKQEDEFPDRPNLIIYLSIGIIIMIVGNLIYNEYIILHFCNLGKNTKKEITFRSKQEIDQCFEIIYLEE